MSSTINSSKVLFLLSLIMVLTAFYSSDYSTSTLAQWEILSTQSISVTIPFIFDVPGMIFSATVLFISANVIWFSSSYISREPNLSRFTLLVLLFVSAINLLIFVPNLICLLVGWDGLGLVSFILVIYYQNHKSCRAGMITALTNRLGDVMLLVSIAWTFSIEDWSISFVNSTDTPYILWFTIIVAAITKRAQVPFSAWLPAAIAAPTPVSALVHSSTLVTAGVFLLFRFRPTLLKTQTFNYVLLIVSSTTMFIAGIIAISEIDMKKIIALSTLRQLGVMIFSLAIGLPQLAFFHLITHALFKACLFICAGNLIHTNHHSQDLRLIGNSGLQMPATTSCIMVSNIALCAMPFIAGFFSKDAIIEISLSINTNVLIFFILSLATALTALYSIRLTDFVFLDHSRYQTINLNRNTEIIMVKPIILLRVGAITGGAILAWTLLPSINIQTLPTPMKIAPISLVLLAGALYSIPISNKLDLKFSGIYSNFISSIWFLNFSRTQLILKGPQAISLDLLKSSDQRWNEMLGPQGINLLISNASRRTHQRQVNSFNNHLLISIMSSIFIFALFIYFCNLSKI